MPGAARLGDKSQVAADAHGCPGCPHPAVGPIVVGSPDVNVNGRPAARLNDTGVHAACCGPNSFEIVKGSGTVYVNNKPLARLNDNCKHCGGTGPIIEGSSDVLIDDGADAQSLVVKMLKALDDILLDGAVQKAVEEVKAKADSITIADLVPTSDVEPDAPAEPAAAADKEKQKEQEPAKKADDAKKDTKGKAAPPKSPPKEAKPKKPPVEKPPKKDKPATEARLQQAEWSMDRAVPGDVVKLKVKAPGVGEGEAVDFVLAERDGNEVARLTGKVKDRVAEASWTVPDVPELHQPPPAGKPADPSKYPVPAFAFEASYKGTHQQQSGALKLGLTFHWNAVDGKGRPLKSENYVLHCADGSERKGNLVDGKLTERAVPVGWVGISLEGFDEIEFYNTADPTVPAPTPAEAPRPAGKPDDDKPPSEAALASSGEKAAEALALENEPKLEPLRDQYRAALEKSANTMSKDDACVILAFLHHAGFIQLLASPFHASSIKPPSVSGSTLLWPKAGDRVGLGCWMKFKEGGEALPEPGHSKVGPIEGHFGYIYNGVNEKWASDRAVIKDKTAQIGNVDPRSAVALYRAGNWMQEHYGVTECYHAGVNGVLPKVRNDCHGQGRALDFSGVVGSMSGTPYEWFVLADWGMQPVPAGRAGKTRHDWPTTNGVTTYRLAHRLEEPQPSPARFFWDFFAFARTNWNATHSPEALPRSFDKLIETDGFIYYPDTWVSNALPDAKSGREAHQNHMHVQIGATGTE